MKVNAATSGEAYCHQILEGSSHLSASDWPHFFLTMLQRHHKLLYLAHLLRIFELAHAHRAMHDDSDATHPTRYYQCSARINNRRIDEMAEALRREDVPMIAELIQEAVVPNDNNVYVLHRLSEAYRRVFRTGPPAHPLEIAHPELLLANLVRPSDPYKPGVQAGSQRSGAVETNIGQGGLPFTVGVLGGGTIISLDGEGQRLYATPPPRATDANGPAEVEQPSPASSVTSWYDPTDETQRREQEEWMRGSSARNPIELPDSDSESPAPGDAAGPRIPTLSTLGNIPMPVMAYQGPTVSLLMPVHQSPAAASSSSSESEESAPTLMVSAPADGITEEENSDAMDINIVAPAPRVPSTRPLPIRTRSMEENDDLYSRSEQIARGEGLASAPTPDLSDEMRDAPGLEMNKERKRRTKKKDTKRKAKGKERERTESVYRDASRPRQEASASGSRGGYMSEEEEMGVDDGIPASRYSPGMDDLTGLSMGQLLTFGDGPSSSSAHAGGSGTPKGGDMDLATPNAQSSFRALRLPHSPEGPSSMVLDTPTQRHFSNLPKAHSPTEAFMKFDAPARGGTARRRREEREDAGEESEVDGIASDWHPPRKKSKTMEMLERQNIPTGGRGGRGRRLSEFSVGTSWRRRKPGRRASQDEQMPSGQVDCPRKNSQPPK